MRARLLIIIVIAVLVVSLIVIEITLAHNGITLPLIINTLYWVDSEHIKPMHIVPYFEDLEILEKYKNSFPYNHAQYTQDYNKKKLYMSAFGLEKTFVDLIVEIKDDDELSYVLYCTEEFTTISKDLNLINGKLDQCIEKYGQNPDEVYLIPNPA